MPWEAGHFLRKFHWWGFSDLGQLLELRGVFQHFACELSHTRIRSNVLNIWFCFSISNAKVFKNDKRQHDGVS